MQHHAALIILSGLFLRPIRAQQNPSDLESYNNPSLTILTCDALPCAQNDNSTICWPGPDEPETREAVGVGLIPNVLSISDSTNLSLTLIDGFPIAGLPQGDDLSTTRTLYVGAPPDTNLSSQRPGCMLMMQYEATTFPYRPDLYSSGRADPNTTTCPSELLYNGLTSRDITSYLRDFEYGDADEGPVLSRCEALALYVEYRLRNSNDFPYLGSYYANLISVTGGPISGPEISTIDLARISTGLAAQDINPDSCQPVQPSSYTLYNVTSTMQLLRADVQVEDQNMTFGGRTGYTPLVSVLYSDDDDDDDDEKEDQYANPEVQFYCVHLRRTDGEELPYGTILSSGGSRNGWSLSLSLSLTVSFIISLFVSM